MNKINVLYQNLNFASGGFIKEKLDKPFSSDDTLTDLLKKASISNYDTYKKEMQNVSGSKVANNKFSKHPRYFSNESIESDVDLDVESQMSIDGPKTDAVRKVTFKVIKRHMNLAINTTDVDTVLTKKIAKANNATEQKHVGSENQKKSAQKQESKDDFLGIKIKTHLIKIIAWLQEIRTTIKTGVMPLEEIEEFSRMERRAIEFSSRFSRHYLYQLNRQLMELRRNSQKPSSARSGISLTRSLTNACQTILQAVQAYCNHIPTTVSIPNIEKLCSGGSIHVKFCELLTNTLNLCKVIRKLGCKYYDVGTNMSLIEDIEENCQTIIPLIKDSLMAKDAPDDKIVAKHTIKSNKKSVKPEKKDLPFHKRNPLENRLSMYSVTFKKNNPNWKKNAEKAAKQRLASSKTTNHPRREDKKKPATKHTHISDGSQVSIDHVKLNEDDLPTLVEATKKTSNSSVKHSENVKSEAPGGQDMRSRLEPLLKTLVAEVTAGKEQDFLSQEVRENMLHKLKDILDQVQQRPATIPGPECNKMRTEPKYCKVVGPKNAKLYCIKNTSTLESNTEANTCDSKFNDRIQVSKNLSVLPALERNDSRKIVPESKPQIANLSKQYTINIIQYKIDFHKYTKPLMMYRKRSHVLPWILTGKITDSLFEHIIVSVISEINIDGLVEKMYMAEFET